ncbi:MAG TPA: hypothetical protein VLZ03_11760 [Thermodesulfobacteriota bacterium]|nr:hypothetical protein [Thermodesulfobacteriota bacterium]
MKRNWVFHVLMAIAISMGLSALPAVTLARESIQQWELINPEGVVKIEPMQVNAHPSSLEGKTVMLRWNGKHNGDLFLDRIGELIAEKVKDVKIVKSWQVALETADISQNENRSRDFIKKLMESKPDIVIGSQCD